MKNLIILMLIFLTLTNCRSRKKIREISGLNRKEFLNIDLKSLSINKDSIIKISENKKSEIKKINNNDGEIIIKGKTDSIKPFEFHNVINGDTISSISISGNADFQIKNHWNKIDEKIENNESNKDLNLVAKTARNIISKETIKKVAEEVKNVRTEVKANGLPFVIYVVLGVILLVSVSLYIIIKTYKK